MSFIQLNLRNPVLYILHCNWPFYKCFYQFSDDWGLLLKMVLNGWSIFQYCRIKYSVCHLVLYSLFVDWFNVFKHLFRYSTANSLINSISVYTSTSLISPQASLSSSQALEPVMRDNWTRLNTLYSINHFGKWSLQPIGLDNLNIAFRVMRFTDWAFCLELCLFIWFNAWHGDTHCFTFQRCAARRVRMEEHVLINTLAIARVLTLVHTVEAVSG